MKALIEYGAIGNEDQNDDEDESFSRFAIHNWRQRSNHRRSY